MLQRKRRRAALKKRSLENSKAQAAEYHKLLVSRLKEQRERRCVWRWCVCVCVCVSSPTGDGPLARLALEGTFVSSLRRGAVALWRCMVLPAVALPAAGGQWLVQFRSLGRVGHESGCG